MADVEKLEPLQKCPICNTAWSVTTQNNDYTKLYSVNCECGYASDVMIFRDDRKMTHRSWNKIVNKYLKEKED